MRCVHVGHVLNQAQLPGGLADEMLAQSVLP